MEKSKKVTYAELDAYEETLNKKYFGTLIDIYVCNKHAYVEPRDRGPLDIEIGWGSPMPTSIEETKKFVALLNEAIEDAEKFPYKGYMLTID